MRVRCLANKSAPVDDPEFGSIVADHALTKGAIYEVIGIESGSYRIIDDGGEPLLFEPELFDVIDPSRPAHWITTIEEGDEYAYAPELGRVGFFEDYHDRKPDAVRTFHRYINEHLRLTDAA